MAPHPETPAGQLPAAARRNPLRSPSCLALLLLALAAPAGADGKRFKWVDDDGKTIFEPVPPDDPARPYCMRDDDGPWTCFDGASRLEAPPPAPDIMTARERQRRADQLLLSRFRSLEAIDRGQAERLAQLDFERRTVERNLELQRRALFEQIGAAADQQRAGLPVTAPQLTTLDRTRANLRDTQAVLARLDAQALEIRREHEAMKQRYRELLEAGPAPSAAPRGGTDD